MSWYHPCAIFLVHTYDAPHFGRHRCRVQYLEIHTSVHPTHISLPVRVELGFSFLKKIGGAHFGVDKAPRTDWLKQENGRVLGLGCSCHETLPHVVYRRTHIPWDTSPSCYTKREHPSYEGFPQIIYCQLHTLPPSRPVPALRHLATASHPSLYGPSLSAVAPPFTT